MIEPLDAALLESLALPSHAQGGDKEDRGRVLIVGGCAEIPGGAMLAGLAALRAGCGKLQIATHASVATGMALAIPEARVVADRPKRVEALLAKCDAAVLGPGWLDETEAASVVRRQCSAAGPPVVLDAAALAGARFACEGGRTVVLTPHAGEMAALMGMDKAEVEADPVQTAVAAAARFGALVALKGANTLIATPDGRILRHDGGVFGLATSGSGDVLAGLVAGLLARGADPLAALAWGVFAHGRAGARLSVRIAPLGFLASELLGEIPGVLAQGAKAAGGANS